MAKQMVVPCVHCGRKFEITVEANPEVTVYRGTDPNSAQSAQGGQETKLVRTCPFCGKDNIVVLHGGK